MKVSNLDDVVQRVSARNIKTRCNMMHFHLNANVEKSMLLILENHLTTNVIILFRLNTQKINDVNLKCSFVVCFLQHDLDVEENMSKLRLLDLFVRVFLLSSFFIFLIVLRRDDVLDDLRRVDHIIHM